MIRKPTFAETQRYGRNWSHHLSNGLVAHWLFNEGSGNTVFDSSLNNNHGAFVNEPKWVDGRYGGSALWFDGVNDSISITAHSSLDVFATHLTVVCTFKNETDADRTIIGKNNSWQVYYHDDNKIVGDEYVGGLRPQTDVASVSLNTWYQSVSVWDESTPSAQAYLNGKKNGTEDTTGTFTDTAGKYIQIGAKAVAPPDFFFNGTIEDIRLYNRALSADEVWELFIDPFADLRLRRQVAGKVPVAALNILDFERGTMRGSNRGILRGVG